MSMVSLLWRFSLVMLVTTASLSWGAPILMNSAPAQAPSPSEGGGDAGGSGDGYQLTVQAFQQRVAKARELIGLLQKLNAEAKAGVPGNPAKQQAYFLAKLNEKFPGSTYDGKKGTITFQKNFEATFTNTMNVDSIVELGEVSARYVLEQGQIQVSYGTNTVTIVLDRTSPARSTFTNVAISAMRVPAEAALSIPGYRRVATDSVETSILNDAYQLLSQTNAVRMDYFAADIMRSAKVQQKALGIAGNGYIERHPQEFQKGADPGAPGTRTVERESRFSASNIPAFAIRLVLVVLLALAVFWGARRSINAVQLLFMDKVSRLYARKYHAHSPMVMRTLGRLGRSLWGMNLPWSRKFYLTKRSDRWQLSDRKIDRLDPNNQPDNLIEVCLRDTNFKVRITRLRGATTDIVLTTSGYSRQNLVKALQQLRAAFTEGAVGAEGATALPAGD